MNDSIKHPDKLASERLKERRLAVGISQKEIEYLFKEIESDFLNNIAEEEGQYEHDVSFDYK
ncbi:hypothetical protein RHHCN13_07510 [Rickettsia conorii subsp. heilongjiangensis]|uniref:Uncharacterized protein n=1 Tax=Rickettsia conorii subsp. heilongjiangensis TaxID=226665 RepID=A0AAD1GI50_RICCR|nr:hypothetical protein [Rickettsia conorii]AEK74538.1 hypothetical protein Rh054_02845 [Rickettsia conorii subsp. heilongjiangensis 054]BBM91314.1 hypothetical protein RHCH81_07510 [Rickettsia conorii subsp. heilongjiangensis]BBM92523.1 hypothetical protein RHHCN13_07510 [Rickettsia conorii subsp. heilongjiangensis]BBM93732.1 hypothetical protein RHSENDAI29_07510 [Rickettsia conorii subsp. heilongjiangensis]BBM94941.1 hypothetical protein RHSENDAI58_07510 [Rickettsia conorii subsp. heilongjia